MSQEKGPARPREQSGWRTLAEAARQPPRTLARAAPTRLLPQTWLILRIRSAALSCGGRAGTTASLRPMAEEQPLARWRRWTASALARSLHGGWRLYSLRMRCTDEEGRHHIKRVHLLTARDTSGLLRQVGQKQREHRELHGTPERNSFLRRTIDDESQQRLAASARLKALGVGSNAGSVGSGWLALPTARAGGWLWRWDDGEARWAACNAGQALLTLRRLRGSVLA